MSLPALRRRYRAGLPSRGITALATAGVLAGTFLLALAGPAGAAPSTPASPARSGSLAAQTSDPSQGQAAHPYMGWSSWSLESTNYPGVNPTGSESWLTEQHVLQQEAVVASTLKPHGYQYINIDAGWWKGFDQYARPQTNSVTFPDGISYIADKVHADGLKLGIYMPVGLDKSAYNGGNTPIYGTTNCFTRDLVYPDLRSTNGWDSAYKMNFDNPCSQAYLDSIASMFAGWHVDFLKLDGVGPGSFKGGGNYDNTGDVAAWSKALADTGRPIQFVISWALSPLQMPTWQAYTNGWRIDTDVECYCNTISTWNSSVKQRWNDVIPFIDAAGPGHWNNLDSVDVGVGAMDGLTDAERQSEMTLWALESAPLYAGDDLTKLDAYGKSLLTNDEVIAVDQAGRPARPVNQFSQQQTWYSANPDGSVTVGLFNLADASHTLTMQLSDIGLPSTATVRDLWSHTQLGGVSSSFSAQLPAHGSRLLTFTPRRSALAAPTGLHAIASTASGFTLAWQPSANAPSGTTYAVRVDNHTVSTVQGTTATVSGLRSGTAHTFQIQAMASSKDSSVWSSVLQLTTAAAGGPTLYEAESPDNVRIGSASAGSCAKCSGGAKVGNLGGGSSVLFTKVTVPADGTYLMKISYLDGDSSRQAIVTPNGGTPIYLNLVGTNNNDWSTPQTTTFPITLHAGTNSVQIGNPSDYVSDVDAVWV
jgi:hypothetical protein